MINHKISATIFGVLSLVFTVVIFQNCAQPLSDSKTLPSVTPSIKQCAAGTTLSGSNCVLISSNTCTIANGTGSLNATTGLCSVASCSAGYVQTGNECTKQAGGTCSVVNGTAQVINGTCQVVSCASGYALSNNSCVKQSDPHQVFLQSLYSGLLARSADDVGVAYWIAQINAGQSCAQVGANFLLGTEGQTAIAGMSNTQYVTILYRGLLHRASAIEQAGLDYYVGQLSNGVKRVEVAGEFLASPEFNSLCSSTYGFSAGAGQYSFGGTIF